MLSLVFDSGNDKKYNYNVTIRLNKYYTEFKYFY